ncbi:CCA tRNA nucleotidyltransferase, mitochondrial [Wickerhamiella sorbophila]|uniref:CCA tRNA nucleotidyltransferase, mitochondrial n=1 Tax=Wickerhamiella sorbophila TaxID=45607 RepID=A0A2T0FK99_9ASCO|nr:CCA tRNA nucleotidyltransferase, mitochondrial [Wickerhamiella sorbophila]PRT55416.1 CCA tRNA nucleotidyltransferase, mitochondrial [Wickerhamiella sorbophila]
MRAKIVLDATELKIRNILLTFTKEYARQTGKQLTLRITGGWVRDKLLGRPSHDLDVAIDQATGEEFATALQQWMAAQSDEKVASVHTIARNPEKSKHLETATTKIEGLDVDFVNLRSEVYTVDSRIPKVEFGTPEQDAFRRDATLNALFYNLDKDQVEDFTGKGLDDLEAGILRTPLDPSETFHDDPLRVLRLIRFVAQLNFTLALETERAMTAPSIRDALQTKVSRERVGVELKKLVAGMYAAQGARYITRLGLAPAIFTLPEQYSPITPNWTVLTSMLDTADAVMPLIKFDYDKPHLWLAMLMSGMSHLTTVDNKKKVFPAPLIAVKEGIKLPTQVGNLVTKVLDSAEDLWLLSQQAASSRLETGLLIRRIGAEWPLCVAYSAIKYNNPSSLNGLYDAVHAMGLQDAHLMKPLLDGKQVSKLFPGRAGGPWLKEALDKAIEFQLENPNATAEDLKTVLLE